MILEKHPQLRALPSEQKLILVTELWDDLAAHPEQVPVTPEQMAEIDRRMEAYRSDPTQVTTWEAIKARILGTTRSAK
jgi:putative addiction module component (TIGR02574 family)